MTWAGRVAFGDGFAYRPGQFLAIGYTQDEINDLFDPVLGVDPNDAEERQAGDLRYWVLPTNAPDLPAQIRSLRRQGLRVQPDHVLFLDSCQCCCGPHPASYIGGQGNPVWANPVWANPVWANPVWANPVWANPASANPVWANPVWANPVWANPKSSADPAWARALWMSRGDLAKFLATGDRRSTARPAVEPKGWLQGAVKQAADALEVAANELRELNEGANSKEAIEAAQEKVINADAALDKATGAAAGGPAGGIRVVILDTGYAGTDQQTKVDHRPAFRPTSLSAVDPDLPDGDNVVAKDGFLDPVAGHGTFIAGLIERVQPGCAIEIHDVVEHEGDVAESELTDTLEEIAKNPPEFLNLSLSGYAFEDMAALASSVAALIAKGTVIVASAGNDGVCIPTYPASLPDVIGVAAIGPAGPAPFTNYGHWVRACAPGTDVVSSFFSRFNGIETPVPGKEDPDDFKGWARWSGTSFSAPIVLGALARACATYGDSNKEAVARVIDDPDRLRIPNLGTVVNMS